MKLFLAVPILILLLRLQFTSAIIGGTLVPSWNVLGQALVFIDHGVRMHRDNRYCTGFLITRWHVTTGAHCCLRKTTRTTIRVGSNWAFDFGETHGVTNVRQIAGHMVHGKDDEYWRMCIMKMNRPVSNRVNTSLLFFPEQNHSPPKVLLAMGFGSTKVGVKEPANQLHSVELPVAHHNYCLRAYSEPLSINPRNTSVGLLCYGYTDAATKLVHFDSGAPLVDPSDFKVWGVALTSLDLKKSDADFYPIFAVDVGRAREEINDAMKHLDGVASDRRRGL